MKKNQIVKSKIEFNNLINSGKQNANKYFVLCSAKKDELNSKFGIAVGKKVGNAVTRNKIKRQIRSIIDKNIKIFPNYHNYIIICKKEILNLKFLEIEKNLLNLIIKGEKDEK